MEFERMEKLAALEHRIDTATEKVRIRIGVRLIDVSQAIEEIRIRLEEIKEEYPTDDDGGICLSGAAIRADGCFSPCS